MPANGSGRGRIVRTVSPGLPYLTVIIGLILLHNAWIAIFGYHAGMIAVLLMSGDHFHLKRLLRGGGWKWFVTGIIGGLISGIAVWIRIPALTSGDLSEYLNSVGLSGAWLAAFAVYFAMVNPWLEEYYWRGYLGSGSRMIVLNDIWFAGYHIPVLLGRVAFPWLVAVFVALVIAAWFWRQADRWGNGLLPSVVSHFAADLTIMSAVVLVLREIR